MPLLKVADSGFVHFYFEKLSFWLEYRPALSLNLVFPRGEADSDVLLSISSVLASLVLLNPGIVACRGHYRS